MGKHFKYDLIIIGGGIVGLATAYQLLIKKLLILIILKLAM
jgi:glycine/D-amino acid oxidase-like deaminating enzyme